MAISTFEGMAPVIHPTAWVHPSSELLGEISLADEVSIWPLCVLRGDSGAIALGRQTNLQDGSVIHATTDISKTTVGEQCTIGHRVILHGCTIGNRCLIGMGSIVLDNVVVGDDSFVAAGSLLTPGKVYPPRSFIVGSPAKAIREVNERDLMMIEGSWRIYVEHMQKHAKVVKGLR